MRIEVVRCFAGVRHLLELVEFETEDACPHLLHRELVLCAKVLRVFPLPVSPRNQLIPAGTLRPLPDPPAGTVVLIRLR